MKRFALLLLCGIIMPYCANAELVATPFPKTYADISFVDKVAVQTEGYVPFMDKAVYQSLDIEPGEEIYTDHAIAQFEHEQFPDIAVIPDTPVEPVSSIEPAPNIPQPTQPNHPVSPTPVVYSGATIGGGHVTENNIVRDESCYLAARDKNFPNKIYTTGRYEKISPAFEKAMITVFRKEGRCGTIANDPCGYTCYGIGSSPKCSGVVVKTRTEAEDFYYNRYWQKYKLYQLPDVISGDIFLASMASGPGTAIKQFSKFLGIKTTTSINNDMINAVQNYNGDIHNNWMDVRNDFLQQVARNRYNGSVSRGYTNAIILKRKNGCHVQPTEPLTR